MNQRPMVEIFHPVQRGNEWLFCARVQTNAGPVNIMASAERPVIAKAFAVLEGYLGGGGNTVGGFFDDAFQVAKSVIQNPLVKQVASYIPYVGTAVAVADTAFTVADGLMKKKPSAAATVNKLQNAAVQASPATAARAAKAVERVNTAQAALKAAKNPAAMAKLKAAAAEGTPGAGEALSAAKAAHRWRLGQIGAGLLKQAAQGSAAANKRIDQIQALASSGDPDAREAAAVLEQLVRNAREAAAQDAPLGQVEGDYDVGALSPAAEAAFLDRMRLRARRRAPIHYADHGIR